MSDGISITVEGGRELEKILLSLEPKIGKTAVRKAVRVGTNIIRDRQKALARANVGGSMGSLLAKHIVSKVPKEIGGVRNGKGLYAMSTQFRKDVPEFVYETHDSTFSIRTRKRLSGARYYIPFAIEFGHAFPGRGKGGDKGAPKDVAAIPFMRPGYRQSYRRAMQMVLDRLNAAIRNENNRVAG